MTFTYYLSGDDENVPAGVEPSDIDTMRLLLNDVDEDTAVFSDEELQQFLTLEGGAVKLAAAQAIDTNADDQALASKVLRSQDVQTDGAKLAQVLHARAERLRAQHFNELEGDGVFSIVEFGDGTRPEHTNFPSGY